MSQSPFSLPVSRVQIHQLLLQVLRMLELLHAELLLTPARRFYVILDLLVVFMQLFILIFL